MPMIVENKNTAQLTANLLKEGRIVLFNPANYPVKNWIDFGEMPTDAKVAPNNTVNRQDVTAANREGGPDVILTRDVTSLSISYDIVSLTPDERVRQLHSGSVPVALTATGLQSVKAYSIDPSTALDGRLIIVRKRPLVVGRTRVHRVIFHPSVDLTSNGTGDSNGKETLLFQATVKPYRWVPGVDLAPLAANLGSYGAAFDVEDSELQDLLDLLDAEAKPAGDDAP